MIKDISLTALFVETQLLFRVVSMTTSQKPWWALWVFFSKCRWLGFVILAASEEDFESHFPVLVEFFNFRVLG